MHSDSLSTLPVFIAGPATGTVQASVGSVGTVHKCKLSLCEKKKFFYFQGYSWAPSFHISSQFCERLPRHAPRWLEQVYWMIDFFEHQTKYDFCFLWQLMNAICAPILSDKNSHLGKVNTLSIVWKSVYKAGWGLKMKLYPWNYSFNLAYTTVNANRNSIRFKCVFYESLKAMQCYSPPPFPQLRVWYILTANNFAFSYVVRWNHSFAT